MPKQYMARAIMRVSYTYISLIITSSWLQQCVVAVQLWWGAVDLWWDAEKIVGRALLNVNLRCINPIHAPSELPNVCYICDRKLWLSIGGAFSQLLAQSGYKRKLPWARNLISQCCWSFCDNFKCWTGRKKNGQLTFKIATKPSVTSGTTRIERNRSKLGVEIHSSQTKALCRM